jgi:CDP-glycerol glycerophosphotransferase
VVPDDRVVLYAPTWRSYVGTRTSKPLHLDPERLTARLPQVVALLRGHYTGTGEDEVFAGHPRIHDVTRYPDISELYLAADALVTDYSSVMFDFVLTDRPLVLLVPDLDRYRDVERGFYFDIEASAPGPMVTTTDEVVTALLAAWGGGDEHAGARAAFRSRFCPHDDGGASARVVDWLLSRR